jgi:PKHD-type hydroxylase
MINNFVIFPSTKDNFVKICHYSPQSEANIAAFCFTPEECEKILAMWDEEKAVQARTAADINEAEANTEKRKSRIQWIGYSQETDWLFRKLFAAVQDANVHRFQFDINGFFEHLQLTKYESDGGHYDWHEDNGGGNFSIRKLSIVVQLTDPEEYDGGEFEVFGIGKSEKAKGTIFVMPSFVTHKVHPVTRGTRFSLVAWVSGPAFR